MLDDIMIFIRKFFLFFFFFFEHFSYDIMHCILNRKSRNGQERKGQARQQEGEFADSLHLAAY